MLTDIRLEDLQVDFDQWIEYYDTRPPHVGYRNRGRIPRASFHQHQESQQALRRLINVKLSGERLTYAA